jgi:DNA-binding MarR family transcriptional regulator
VTSTPESRWQGPEHSPGFLLWQVTLAWQRAMRTALAPHELTHVQFVLLTTTWWLGKGEMPPTQQRLAGQAGTDTMMTSQVVRKLADRGLLVREPDPADARARRLRITESGLALVAKALADVERADAEFFAALGDTTPGFVTSLAKLAE